MAAPGRTPTGTRTTRARARRAVSDSDKAARRAAILTAAEQQLRAAGIDAFSMETLARTLEVARGTLYRYFPTREAVLLELYLAQRARFVAKLSTELTPGIEDHAFVERWYEHATSDPLFLMLQSRLGSVIEHNIPTDRLIEAKRVMQTEMEAFSGYLASCLSLDAARCRRLIVGLVALLLGAAELDHPPPLDGLPPGIADTLAFFASRRVFTDNAGLIVSGLRRETAG